jgi:hypothetical protein
MWKWIKLIILGIAVVVIINLYVIPKFEMPIDVPIDNRTSQCFLIVLDGYERGRLYEGGVIQIPARRNQRNLELRWVDPITDGVSVIFIPVDNTMGKVFIQGHNPDYKVEFVGREHD